MSSEYAMIIATFPDREAAKKIARLLVEKQLAACVQMFPIESVYRWKGEICEDSEIALFIKSRAALFADIANTIKELHPYEVSEIILLPIADGLPEYLGWIGECTEQNAEEPLCNKPT